MSSLTRRGSCPHYTHSEVRDYELVLRNGTRLGHRSLLRYYKQRLRPTPLEQRDANNEAVVINRVAAHYRELGFPGASTLTIGEQRKMVQQGFADARRRDKARASLAERVGMANNNQKHYRAQIDF